MDLGLEGKTAIVTGASHGLGRATALALAKEGVRVAICGRYRETIEAAALSIEDETKGEVLPFVCDVMIKSDIEDFVAATVARFGAVDILINNADSVSHQGSFFDLTDEDWIEKFNIKLLAHIRFIRLVAPFMQERGWGRIISIGGGSTRKMREGGWTKGATQAGLINLAKKLSELLGTYGITVNVVEPGGMWSDGATKEGRSRADTRREAIELAAKKAGVSYDEMNKRELSKLVIGRRIEPEDTAGIITFLVSDRAATITGEVVLADGGQNRAVRF